MPRHMLAIGDVVSVAVRQFGEEYARRIAGRAWASEKQRCEGLVVDKDGANWLVEFSDMDEPVALKRHLLELVRRGGEGRARPGDRNAPLQADSSSDEEALEGGQRQQRHQPSGDAPTSADTNPDESEGSDLSSDAAEEDEEGAAEGEWTREDNFCMDERARHSLTSKQAPALNMRNYKEASLFSIIVYWLSPILATSQGSHDRQATSFLEGMAQAMQARGRAKASGPSDRWAQWCVTYKDVLQWLGCWYYMLAFPQSSDREDYFSSPAFGPNHCLAAVLAQGENGYKGRRWFNSMHACFTLPTGDVPDSDPFRPVRCMWESYRQHLTQCIDPSWLLLLDESMVKWLGRNMPGLMVVKRKPTPIGAELHTMCCAVSGILINFELYEGKDRMAKKEFCNEHP